jgi:hypothetical protein
MQEIFKEILDQEDITGCLYVDRTGQILYSHFRPSAISSAEKHNWQAVIKALGNISEADILFEQIKLFLRRTNNGYLLVRASQEVGLSLIKLQLDLLVQKLNDYKPKPISRFFKK